MLFQKVIPKVSGASQTMSLVLGDTSIVEMPPGQGSTEGNIVFQDNLKLSK